MRRTPAAALERESRQVSFEIHAMNAILYGEISSTSLWQSDGWENGWLERLERLYLR
jgi:hypothetical protein